MRFFGGWDFEPVDIETRNPGAIGYGKGAPMGGDLTAAPEGKVPSFLVAALRDPKGALSREMGIVGLPVTVILNPEGAEVGRLIGDADWNSAEARAVLTALMAP